MLDLLLLLLSLCRPARLLSWALCLAGVLVLWLAMEKATLRDYIKARARYNSYYEQVQRLQRQQQQYKTELSDIKAGGFRLEKTIREQCPLIRPGEKVVYIELPDDEKNAAAPRLSSPPPRPAVEAAPALPLAAEPAETPAPKKKALQPAATAAEQEQDSAAPPAGASRSGRTASPKAAAETVSGKRSAKGKTATKSAAKKSSRTAATKKTALRTAEF